MSEKRIRSRTPPLPFPLVDRSAFYRNACGRAGPTRASRFPRRIICETHRLVTWYLESGLRAAAGHWSVCFFGLLAFRVSAPKVWNTLPLHIRQSQSLSTFRRHLKTHYFQLAYPATYRASIHRRALILFIQTLVLYKSFTYLLTYFILKSAAKTIDTIFIIAACAQLYCNRASLLVYLFFRSCHLSWPR